jgi:hypothetical protein
MFLEEANNSKVDRPWAMAVLAFLGRQILRFCDLPSLQAKFDYLKNPEKSRDVTYWNYSERTSGKRHLI